MGKLNLDESDTDISQFTAYSTRSASALKGKSNGEKPQFCSNKLWTFQDSIGFGITFWTGNMEFRLTKFMVQHNKLGSISRRSRKIHKIKSSNFVRQQNGGN